MEFQWEERRFCSVKFSTSLCVVPTADYIDTSLQDFGDKLCNFG